MVLVEAVLVVEDEEAIGFLNDMSRYFDRRKVNNWCGEAMTSGIGGG